jgi:hypothetical protein
MTEAPLDPELRERLVVRVERMARRLAPVLARLDPEAAASLLAFETMAAIEGARATRPAR